MTILVYLFTFFLGCNHYNNNGVDVFTPNSQWIYEVTTIDSNEFIQRRDTILLTVEKGSFLISQKKISWTIKNTLPDGSTEEVMEVTGVVENEDRVWLHPPRFDFLKFTELTPFPEIKLPIKVGNTWSSTLSIGAGWGDWNGEKVKSNYKIIGIDTEQNHTLNNDSCYVVSAISNSNLGTYNVTYCFSPHLGFVFFKYEHPDGILTNINLIKKNKNYSP